MLLLVSETEILGTYSADLFFTSKEEPRLNLRGLKDFDESKDAAPVVAANALRGHDDVAVSGSADVFYGLFMNRV